MPAEDDDGPPPLVAIASEASVGAVGSTSSGFQLEIEPWDSQRGAQGLLHAGLADREPRSARPQVSTTSMTSGMSTFDPVRHLGVDMAADGSPRLPSTPRRRLTPSPNSSEPRTLFLRAQAAEWSLGVVQNNPFASYSASRIDASLTRHRLVVYPPRSARPGERRGKAGARPRRKRRVSVDDGDDGEGDGDGDGSATTVSHGGVDRAARREHSRSSIVHSTSISDVSEADRSVGVVDLAAPDPEPEPRRRRRRSSAQSSGGGGRPRISVIADTRSRRESDADGHSDGDTDESEDEEGPRIHFFDDMTQWSDLVGERMAVETLAVKSEFAEARRRVCPPALHEVIFGRPAPDDKESRDALASMMPTVARRPFAASSRAKHALRDVILWSDAAHEFRMDRPVGAQLVLVLGARGSGKTSLLARMVADWPTMMDVGGRTVVALTSDDIVRAQGLVHAIRIKLPASDLFDELFGDGHAGQPRAPFLLLLDDLDLLPDELRGRVEDDMQTLLESADESSRAIATASSTGLLRTPRNIQVSICRIPPLDAAARQDVLNTAFPRGDVLAKAALEALDASELACEMASTPERLAHCMRSFGAHDGTFHAPVRPAHMIDAVLRHVATTVAETWAAVEDGYGDSPPQMADFARLLTTLAWALQCDQRRQFDLEYVQTVVDRAYTVQGASAAVALFQLHLRHMTFLFRPAKSCTGQDTLEFACERTRQLLASRLLATRVWHAIGEAQVESVRLRFDDIAPADLLTDLRFREVVLLFLDALPNAVFLSFCHHLIHNDSDACTFTFLAALALRVRTDWHRSRGEPAQGALEAMRNRVRSAGSSLSVLAGRIGRLFSRRPSGRPDAAGAQEMRTVASLAARGISGSPEATDTEWVVARAERLIRASGNVRHFSKMLIHQAATVREIAVGHVMAMTHMRPRVLADLTKKLYKRPRSNRVVSGVIRAFAVLGGHSARIADIVFSNGASANQQVRAACALALRSFPLTDARTLEALRGYLVDARTPVQQAAVETLAALVIHFDELDRKTDQQQSAFLSLQGGIPTIRTRAARRAGTMSTPLAGRGKRRNNSGKDAAARESALESGNRAVVAFGLAPRSRLPALLELLSSPNWVMRANTCRAVARATRIRLGTRLAVLSALTALFSDEYSAVRVACICAATAMMTAGRGMFHPDVIAVENVADRADRALKFLVTALDDSSVDVRRAAADGLPQIRIHIARKEAIVLTALVTRRLTESDRPTVLKLEAAVRRVLNGDRTVSQLIPRLNSKYWRVRMETANVIAYLAPSLDASRLEEYMGGLIVALHDDEAAVAAAAAHALAKIGVDSPAVLDALRGLVRWEVNDVRLAAMHAYRQLRDVDERRLMETLLPRLAHSSPVVRAETVALIESAGVDESSQIILEALATRLEDSNDQVVGAVLHCLAELHFDTLREHPFCYNIIVTGLLDLVARSDKAPHLTAAAIAVLDQVVASDVRVIEAIVRILQNPNAQVRRQATLTLAHAAEYVSRRSSSRTAIFFSAASSIGGGTSQSGSRMSSSGDHGSGYRPMTSPQHPSTVGGGGGGGGGGASSTGGAGGGQLAAHAQGGSAMRRMMTTANASPSTPASSASGSPVFSGSEGGGHLGARTTTAPPTASNATGTLRPAHMLRKPIIRQASGSSLTQSAADTARSGGGGSGSGIGSGGAFRLGAPGISRKAKSFVTSPEHIVNAVLGRLRDSDETVREAAIQTLLALNVNNDTVLTALRNMLDSTGPSRLVAARALGVLSTDVKSTHEKLTMMLRAGHGCVETEADVLRCFGVLGHKTTAVVDVLVEWIERDDASADAPEPTVEAIRSLSALQLRLPEDRRPVDAIVGALSSPHGPVRLAAAVAISETGDWIRDRGITAAVLRLIGDRDPEVLKTACHVLIRKMDSSTRKTETVVKSLAARLREPAAEMRMAVLNVFPVMGFSMYPKVMPKVIRRARDRDAGVRREAAIALGDVVQDLDGLIDRTLVALIDDPDAQVCLEACRSLGRRVTADTDALVALVADKLRTDTHVVHVRLGTGDDVAVPWARETGEIERDESHSGVSSDETEDAPHGGLGAFGTPLPSLRHVTITMLPEMLGSLGSASATVIGALTDAFRYHFDSAVRCQAALALSQLWNLESSADVSDALWTAMPLAHSTVRQAAVRAMQELGHGADPIARRALVQQLGHKDASVREEAASLLVHLTTHAKNATALPSHGHLRRDRRADSQASIVETALRARALLDEQRNVRFAAARALALLVPQSVPHDAIHTLEAAAASSPDWQQRQLAVHALTAASLFMARHESSAANERSVGGGDTSPPVDETWRYFSSDSDNSDSGEDANAARMRSQTSVSHGRRSRVSMIASMDDNGSSGSSGARRGSTSGRLMTDLVSQRRERLGPPVTTASRGRRSTVAAHAATGRPSIDSDLFARAARATVAAAKLAANGARARERREEESRAAKASAAADAQPATAEAPAAPLTVAVPGSAPTMRRSVAALPPPNRRGSRLRPAALITTKVVDDMERQRALPRSGLAAAPTTADGGDDGALSDGSRSATASSVPDDDDDDDGDGDDYDLRFSRPPSHPSSRAPSRMSFSRAGSVESDIGSLSADTDAVSDAFANIGSAVAVGSQFASTEDVSSTRFSLVGWDEIDQSSGTISTNDTLRPGTPARTWQPDDGQRAQNASDVDILAVLQTVVSRALADADSAVRTMAVRAVGHVPALVTHSSYQALLALAENDFADVKLHALKTIRLVSGPFLAGLAGSGALDSPAVAVTSTTNLLSRAALLDASVADGQRYPNRSGKRMIPVLRAHKRCLRRVLVAGLVDVDARVRRDVAETIMHLGIFDTECMIELVRRMQLDRQSVTSAAEAYIDWCADDVYFRAHGMARVTRVLHFRIRAEHRMERVRALQTIPFVALAGSNSLLSTVLEALRDAEPVVRTEAARAVGHLLNPAHETDFSRQIAAGDSVIAQHLLDLLLERLREDTSVLVKLAVLETLGELRIEGKHADILKVLRDVAGRRKPSGNTPAETAAVRAAAVRAMGRLGGSWTKRTVAAFASLLADEYQVVRDAVITILRAVAIRTDEDLLRLLDMLRASDVAPHLVLPILRHLQVRALRFPFDPLPPAVMAAVDNLVASARVTSIVRMPFEALMLTRHVRLLGLVGSASSRRRVPS